MTKKKAAPKNVESTAHADKRANIPTAELRNFVPDDVKNGEPMLYPRDPTLDPQLVWKGKDEQDREGLIVPTVPVYIQEKIDPRALVDDLRARHREELAGETMSLFDDFDDRSLGFDQVVDFYEHQNNWSNRLILGDALTVMNSLSEKEGLKGQVQMIYIDPPYGIKFESNWQVSTRKRDVKDGRDATRQPEQVKAFRDTWEHGNHSYLSYLRDRLVVARELLTSSGSIFVQIGDENMHLVRSLLDEVFGLENYVTTIIVKKKSATTPTDAVNDYLLWATKDRSRAKIRQLFAGRRDPDSSSASKFRRLVDVDGTIHSVSQLSDLEVEQLLSRGARWARVDWPITSQHPDDVRSAPYEMNGREYSPGRNRQWTFGVPGQMERLEVARRLYAGTDTKGLGGIVYWDDWPYVQISNLWEDFHGESGAVYVVQTNRKIVDRCILMTTDPGDLVLDPTCGSGTTAVSAELWGRRWITIDTSRVALALARARLMAGVFPFFALLDSELGRDLENSLGGAPLSGPMREDVRLGFVYERAKRVTLKSVVETPDIARDMPLSEIESAIRSHADEALLLDRPYEDKNTVRVTGRFTVESLSPHRSLDAVSETTVADTEDFASIIIDNLRKAGVQNTYAGERIKFDRLELVQGGQWIHAEGEFTDADGNTRTVAISLGPEHGTVSPDQVKEAAKEALKGVGYDLLLVCGFAFDALANESAKEFAPDANDFEAAVAERKFGKLRVLLTRMNPDLAMGEDLLKKTGSGNLFMVFGEPDVDITETDDGVVVEVRGVDVYDPTTGELRSGTTREGVKDIAAWFIDTNYNSESFFVRHAYFTGSGKAFDQLAKALKADLAPEAWDDLYRTKSMPFPAPETGRIAIKVINHYGDEVMQVYQL